MTYYIALVLCIRSVPHRYVLTSVLTDSMRATPEAQAKQGTCVGMDAA
jgi:hypothetical protein